MAHSAHDNEEDVKEIYDSSEDLETKIKLLADLVKQSKHLVVFTGAGISTSAGIHDFRGPTGKWTREAKGLKPLKGTDTVKAYPTPTHMSFVKLAQEGVLKYMISQNCDGLNVRSSFPQDQLSELHGNGNIEICEDCGQKYFRDHRTPVKKHTGMRRDRWTGRHCGHEDCRGRLLKSTICFGQNLPDEPLTLAEEHSAKADLHIALGSSLMVTPAADCPRDTVHNGGKLVIINLQNTPLTNMAEFQIYGKTDEVMTRLMELLGYEIPQFSLKRKIVCGVDPKEKGLYIRGAALTDETLEHHFIRSVEWSKPEIRDCDGVEHAAQVVESKIVSNQFSGFEMRGDLVQEIAEGQRVFVDVAVESMGNYFEPCLKLSNDFTEAYLWGKRVEYVWDLDFNPYTKVWTTSVRLSSVPSKTSWVKDDSFGKICEEYAVAGMMKKGQWTRYEARKRYRAHVERNRRPQTKALVPVDLATN